MHIRNATLADLETVVALNAFVQQQHADALPGLFRPPSESSADKAAFQGFLSDPAALMLLAEDPGPAGYLWAQFQDRPASWARQASRLLYIQHMAVAPSFRQKGIGSRLLARAIEIARREGIQRVELDVWSFNSEARRFYASHHFAVFNERMALDLNGTGRKATGNGENL